MTIMTKPPAKYSIRTDPRSQMITVVQSGLYTIADLIALSADFAAAIAKLAAHGGVPGQYLLLVDLRDHAIQTKEIADLLQTGVAAQGHLWRRMATVVSPSALQAMQAKRIGQVGSQALFQDRDAATAWLLAG
jgi:hypothetical protein